MTNQPAQSAVSLSRRRMLEDMTMRGLGGDKQRDYGRFVRSFAAFPGRSSNAATAEDIRRFEVYQRETGAKPPDDR